MESHPTDAIAKRARAFRRALTEPEAMLWFRLKGRGKDRPIFRRQFPYETMIFDFYCPAARLAIEVDGRTNWSDEAQEKDARRDAWLAQRGIAVMRIGAGRIYGNPGGEADAVILRALERIAAKRPD
jgi:very-short-patch-repair endonuclease